MARISGNIQPNGTKTSNTSNSKNDFSVDFNEYTQMYTITYDKPFKEVPSVLVNRTNQEIGPNINVNITTAINPGKEYSTIQFWNNDENNYEGFNFCFAAFGDLA
ncbi:hypothetical protein [Pseudotenacibaculum haliotis]|uniref:H-type lectin domain-containing protein n=1 Tax=Pseudotenacibaculum haliotis TaxID=1862138 RepID=A0ABW5LNP7_9FLAO